MNYVHCRDCRGVSFDIYDNLLYVEKRTIKIRDASITYSFSYVIKPKEIEYNTDTNTWVLHACKTGISDQEIVIHGKMNQKHPELYCLKSKSHFKECLIGYELLTNDGINYHRGD